MGYGGGYHDELSRANKKTGFSRRGFFRTTFIGQAILLTATITPNESREIVMLKARPAGHIHPIEISASVSDTCVRKVELYDAFTSLNEKW